MWRLDAVCIDSCCCRTLELDAHSHVLRTQQRAAAGVRTGAICGQEAQRALRAISYRAAFRTTIPQSHIDCLAGQCTAAELALRRSRPIPACGDDQEMGRRGVALHVGTMMSVELPNFGKISSEASDPRPPDRGEATRFLTAFVGARARDGICDRVQIALCAPRAKGVV